jgi:tetratricopeptide (TPR) repeat protein
VQPDPDRAQAAVDIAADEVRAALDAVTASAAFGTAKRPARFLRHLVESALRGDGHLLKESVLGVDVFDRPASWDPRLDPVVRQEAARLRKRLANYYGTSGADAGVRIELPVGSYVPLFRRTDVVATTGPAAIPPVEATPFSDSRPVPEVRPNLRRRWISVAALLLAVVATGFVYVRFIQPDGSGRVIASHGERVADPVAQDLYLKGKYYWDKRTPESLNQAVDLFTQAIVRDPGYAKAYSGLADCYNLLREYAAMPAREAWPRAIAAAKKAVELDDSSAEAHSSLAFVLYYGALDLRGGEREFRRAIQLNPDYAKAHHWYATALMVQGRYQESLAEIERARELDPASTSILADKGYVLFYGGQPDQSVALLKQVEAAEPASQSAHNYLANIYLKQNDFAGYLLESRKAAELSRNSSALAVWEAAQKGFAAGGAHGMLENMLHVQRDLVKEGRWLHYDAAKTFMLLGKQREALDELQAAVDNREMNILVLASDPVFASLHSDARFQELQKELRLVLRG